MPRHVTSRGLNLTSGKIIYFTSRCGKCPKFWAKKEALNQ